MVHKLVDYTFDSPAGRLGQEIGGVGLTLLALAEAADHSAEACEAAEIERVLSKPLSHFAARNKVKNDAGFDLTPASGIVAATAGETRQGLDERSEQSPVGEAETPQVQP
jgi:hypothetical protein